jgi:hypothetical protein
MDMRNGINSNSNEKKEIESSIDTNDENDECVRKIPSPQASNPRPIPSRGSSTRELEEREE